MLFLSRATRRHLEPRLLAALILAVSALGQPAPVAAADEQKILVVYSTRRDTQFSTVGDQTMPGLLERGLGNKVGFDGNALWGKGLGLISMRERLDAVGGSLTIQSRPDRGTRLQIIVPDVAARTTATVAV